METLPEVLASCDGPYRIQRSNISTGISVWSHVNDERCTLLHDNIGNAIVALESRIITGQPPSVVDMAHGAPLSKELWAEMVREAGTSASVEHEGSVMCTSAGQTTRLVFDLMETAVPLDTVKDDVLSASRASTGPSFELASRQDGSVISSAYSFFHLRVLRKSGQPDSDIIDVGANHQVPKTPGRDEKKELTLKIALGEAVTTTISLDRASNEGFFFSLGGREGTWLFDICLFETPIEAKENNQNAVEQDCVAKTASSLEIFSSDEQLIYRRRSSEVLLPPRARAAAGGLKMPEDPKMTRITFVTDLEVVDGYKLSTLHLMKHLPSNFQSSALDLSCSCEMQIK